MPGTSLAQSSTPELVDNPSQLGVQGAGGSTAHTSVQLYNASSKAQKVTGTYRALGSETAFGSPVTENVSAPPPPFPAQGATAAAPVHFTVPSGVSVLDADMRWPDPTNNDANILTFILTDPAGKVAQSSYDYGASEYVPCPNGGVRGTLSVIDSTDFSATDIAIGFPLFSDFHDFAYAYKVGS